MIRRSALHAVGGWRERGWPEDVDLWLRLIAAGARFAKVPRVLYQWRQHATSATRSDPRYSQSAFDAMRLDALGRGLLRGHREPTLVGVGESLERWRRLLTQTGYRPSARAIGRPNPAVRLAPPALLVFGASPARRRWRALLCSQGWTECTDFAFVA
jgi:hypothetical protein